MAKITLDGGEYQSPRWTAEVADCAMPMTFDQYSVCAWGCLYCFAAYQKSCGVGKERYAARSAKAVNPEKVKRLFLDPDAKGNQFGEYIKARKVLQWGGLADPFCALEAMHGVGLGILRFLREIDYPVTFSTKGTWWTTDERYMELFRGNPNWTVKFTVITQDPWKARLVEPGTPSPKARLRALERIASAGCGGAILRLRPFMVGISNPGHVELIESAARAGAMSMSTEFFCVEQRSTDLREKMKTINRAAGFDVFAFYKRFSSGKGYLRLNRNVKRPFVDEMEAAAKASGLRFYVSDAHFKERSCDGNCCGLGAGFEWSKGQFTEALLIAKREGRVRWADVSGDMEHLKGFLWRRATGFNTQGVRKESAFWDHTMFDYMRWLWNNPDAGQSMYTMFEGIVRPDGVDLDGNLIYVFDQTRA